MVCGTRRAIVCSRTITKRPHIFLKWAERGTILFGMVCGLCQPPAASHVHAYTGFRMCCTAGSAILPERAAVALPHCSQFSSDVPLADASLAREVCR